MSDPDRHLREISDEDNERRMTPEALEIVLRDLRSRVADAAARSKHRVPDVRRPRS
jgi:hypothetical protein